MDFPDEIRVDIFSHLDRLSLEVLKRTCRRFERIIYLRENGLRLHTRIGQRRPGVEEVQDVHDGGGSRRNGRGQRET